MTLAKAESQFRGFAGTPVERMTARRGIAAMLEFYAQHRAESSSIDKDGDTLLFQWGTNGFAAPATFQLNITRQFIVPNEDEPYQLLLTFHFDHSNKLDELGSGNKWCNSPSRVDAFRRLIETSAAFAVVADAKPSRVDLFYEQC
jgi:hypothetical protein